MSKHTTVKDAAKYHDGVLYGIRHPGPAAGCVYCEDTLKQKHLIDSWATKDAHITPPGEGDANA